MLIIYSILNNIILVKNKYLSNTIPHTTYHMPENKTTSTKTKQKDSTLNFLEVAEIRDRTIVLREGQMRTVLVCSSTNFALKSLQEQDIIIGAFQGVLNSLDFPVQILMQSRKIDLSVYIKKLQQLEYTQTNDLLRVKMQEYIQYIQEMLREVNIMKKDFYVIVQYDPVSLNDTLFGRFWRSLNSSSAIKQKNEEFIRNQKLLLARADQMASRLSQLDLKVQVLDTEQIIALLYNSYNPDTLESIRLRDVSSLNI